MLEVSLGEGSVVKKVVEAIKEVVVTGANFVFSTTGFSLKAMDPTHEAMVAILLRSDGFEHYRCDTTFTMGLSLDEMVHILHEANDHDIITVKAQEARNGVSFIFQSHTQDKESSDYWMNLINMGTGDLLNIPEDAEYHATVKMPSAKFSRICTQLASVGNKVTITVTKEDVKFSTTGDDGDIGTSTIVCSHSAVLDQADEEATEIEMNESVRQLSLTFELKYLKSFTKATPLSNTVSISLSNELPAAPVEYKIAEMGYARFYLRHSTLQ